MKNAWIFPGILYVFLCIVELIAVSAGLDDLHFIVKPMLMPMLAATALVMFQMKSAPKAIIGFLMAALACHTAGDIFLLFPDSKYFIYGLLSFFTGHVFYIAILGSYIRENTMTENPVSIKRISIYTSLAVILPVVLVVVAQLKTSMAIYVGVYAWILVSLAYLAGRIATLKLEGGNFVLAGSILFIISDALLGMNQFFNLNFPLRHAVVMLTYTVAQGLLVYGIGKFYRYTEKKEKIRA